MKAICTEPYKSALVILFIAAVTAAIYSQSIYHDFIMFDDGMYVYENMRVRNGVTIDGIKWAFGFTREAYWHPLTWFSHMLDVELFGLNSGMHHLMNGIFHLLNSVLIFIFFRITTGSYVRSAVVAILFAAHPINVDSVAWLAERKNLLSSTFWMLCMIQYVHYTRNPGILRYIGLIGIFILGLLAKPMIVTLPFVLLLLDFWPLHRFEIKQTVENRENWKAGRNRYQWQGMRAMQLILEKMPLLILSLISIIITFLSLRHHGGKIVADQFVPMAVRLENAIVSYSHYLFKLFWPHDLTFYYPFPSAVPFWQFIGSLVILLAVTILAVKFVLRASYIIVGWLWYLGTLVPVLGIIQGGLWPAIAERWAYIPFIGIYFMLVWGIFDLVRGRRKERVLLLLAVSVIIPILMTISWLQVGHWKNDYALCNHALRVNPENAIAHTHLGNYFGDHKQYKKALYHYEKALGIQPDEVVLLGNIAWVYTELGNKEVAMRYLSRATDAAMRGYDNIDAHYTRGLIYEKIEEPDKAISEYSYVVSKEPAHVLAIYNLGVLHSKKGDREKALSYFNSAHSLRPDNPKINNALGVVLMDTGKIDEATGYFKAALRLDPEYAAARKNLTASMNFKKGAGKRMNDKIAMLEDQLLKKPDDPKTLHALAALYVSKGEEAKALELLTHFIQVEPDNPAGYYNIACIYSRMHEVDKATEWLKKSIDRGFADWGLLNKDKDLENIRGTAYYKDLVREVPN